MSARARITNLAGIHEAHSGLMAIVALGTSLERPVWTNKFAQRVKIQSVGYLPNAAATGNTTHNFVLTAKNKGTAGTGTTSVATLTFATGVDLVAFVEKALTLTTTDANLYLAAGETLSLAKSETGNGLELPLGMAVITFTFE